METKRIKFQSIRRDALKMVRQGHQSCCYREGTPPIVRNFNSALRTIAIESQWDALERAGLVRLDIVPDDCADLDNLLGDCFNLKTNQPFPGGRHRMDEQREEEIERINREGVWGVCGRFRLSESDKWQTADSCFGFVGEDWKGSGYDLDIKVQTITTLRDALKDRFCPKCGTMHNRKGVI